MAVGYDAATDRELFLLELERLEELPPTLRIPSRHFALLLVLDGREVEPGELHRSAAHLLGQGAVSLSVWGPACGRIRALLDDAILFSETEATEESIVLTEEHEGEPPSRTPWSTFLSGASPPPAISTAAGRPSSSP